VVGVVVGVVGVVEVGVVGVLALEEPPPQALQRTRVTPAIS
jgi:hypothetical protein